MFREADLDFVYDTRSSNGYSESAGGVNMGTPTAAPRSAKLAELVRTSVLSTTKSSPDSQ